MQNTSPKKFLDISKEVFNNFGFDCELEIVPKPKGLPLYMVQGRTILKATICGTLFIIIAVNDDEKFAAEALAKQIKKYEFVTSRPVALLFGKTSLIQQKALFENRVPFLSPPATMFLPFLGIAMQIRKSKESDKIIDIEKKLSPQSQILFLYMLYKIKNKHISKAEAARAIGLNAMSVSRSSKELEARGLIKLQDCGNNIQMTCTSTNLDLFHKALPYLINPIEKCIIVKRDSLKQEHPLAGETALSTVSMLSPPQMQTTACTKKDIPPSTIDYTNDARWMPATELSNLQIWKYSPTLFATNGMVDPVSLYMSLKDSNDERIQASLEEMMEFLKW